MYVIKDIFAKHPKTPIKCIMTSASTHKICYFGDLAFPRNLFVEISLFVGFLENFSTFDRTTIEQKHA